MRSIRLVLFSVLGIGVLSLVVSGQQKWTYEGKQGTGYFPISVTIIITSTPNGYVVTGRLTKRVDNGDKYCSLQGTYVRQTGRFEAQGDCIYKGTRERQGTVVSGFKMEGRDALQITAPYSFVAYRAGTPQRTTVPKVLTECEEYRGSVCGTWTIRGNQIDAVWNNGAKAVLTIEKFDYDEVVFTRRDTASSATPGFSARYTGRISGFDPRNKIVDGVVTWTNNGKSWSGTWTAEW